MDFNAVKYKPILHLRLSDQDYKVLKAIDGYSVKDIGSTSMTMLSTDPQKSIEHLWKNNLIKISNYKEALKFLPNEHLKIMMLSKNIKVRGQHNVMVKNAMEAFTQEECEAFPFFTYVYMLTNKGKLFLEDYITKEKLNEYDMEKNCLKLINKKHFDKVRIIYQTFYDRIDDIKELTSYENDTLKRMFDYEIPIDVLTMTIYLYLTDNAGMRLDDFMELHFNKRYSVPSIIKFKRSVADTYTFMINLIELNRLKNSGDATYKFMANLRLETCPICRDLDNKVFKISDAKASVNFPPMHKGCSCRIAANDYDDPNMLRTAINPVNKHSYQTSCKNYHEWLSTVALFEVLK